MSQDAKNEIKKLLDSFDPYTSNHTRLAHKIAERLESLGYRKQPTLLTDAEIKAKLGAIQPEGFNWTDLTDAEMVKFKAIAQAQRDKAQ